MFHVKHLRSAMGAAPRNGAAPLRREPREPHRGNNRTQAAAQMGEKPVPIPMRRKHSDTVSKSEGVYGGEGVPAKPSFRLCGERRSKGANAVFAAGENEVSGLCDDERALWVLSLA